MKMIFSFIYLTTKQGCRPSVAAAVLDDDELFLNDEDDCCYLQPYWLPGIPLRNKKSYQNTDQQQQLLPPKQQQQRQHRVPHPMFEMMGPYQGYRLTDPRLPPYQLHRSDSIQNDSNDLSAGEALWKACEEITGSKLDL